MTAVRGAGQAAPAGPAVRRDGVLRPGHAVRPGGVARPGHAVRPGGVARSAQPGSVARAAAALATAALAVLALAGCGRAANPLPSPLPSPESPFAPCPEPAAESLAAAEGPLAGLSLPCFTGGEPVALDRLGRPAVINLWASWCPPCRDELPELQAFADEMGDHVLVLGVATDDRWSAAAWAGIDFEVRYPNLFDPDKTLLQALGRAALPVTLIVAADGSIAATDVSGSLTREELRALVSENLGLD